MTHCFFVSDLHGRTDRYHKLFAAIVAERPAAVLLGGDLLPSGLGAAGQYRDFARDFLAAEFGKLAETLGASRPRVLLILGNDDPRSEEAAFKEAAARGIWEYIHEQRVELGPFAVYGYAYVPPTPFRLKDWERYDVSRHVDVGEISPEEGVRSVPVDPRIARYATISEDLAKLAADDSMQRAAFLFHAPPYDSNLDRAALDGKTIDHVPLDVHVGSIAIKRFIESRQPLVTLHGHIHESARITGSWRDRIGRPSACPRRMKVTNLLSSGSTWSLPKTRPANCSDAQINLRHAHFPPLLQP